MSLKGFAVLYGDQMSELGITTDELFQQKSLFDFAVNWEIVVEKKEKKLIENSVQDFSSLPKENFIQEKSNQITSPMTLKIEVPVTKITTPQVQSQVQAKNPQTTPLQAQAQKAPQISERKVQAVQKPTAQLKNSTTPLQTPAANKLLIKKPENPSIIPQILKTPVVTTPPRPIEEKNLTQTTEKTLEKPTTIKPQQAYRPTPISQAQQTTPATIKTKSTITTLGFASVEKNFKSLFTWNTKNWLKEAKIFSILLVSVLTIFFFFTNAQLVMVMAQDLFSSNGSWDHQLLLEENTMHQSAELKPETAEELQQLETQFAKIKQNKLESQTLSTTMEEFLDKKWEQHTIDFNTLPPGNRLIIPDLNINAPLVDTEENGVIDFSKENFDEELTKGVVKYPTTPTPGNKGNTLIFGHTSSEWWKKNEYGVIFRNIPKLKAGQKFYVIWNGKKTAYEMLERKVVRPKDVENYYHEFSDKNESYLTLMGCYPIWTADKRMMVVAKKIEE